MLAKSCKVVSFFYSCSQPSNRRSSLLPDHPPVDHADYCINTTKSLGPMGRDTFSPSLRRFNSWCDAWQRVWWLRRFCSWPEQGPIVGFKLKINSKSNSNYWCVAHCVNRCCMRVSLAERPAKLYRISMRRKLNSWLSFDGPDQGGTGNRMPDRYPVS